MYEFRLSNFRKNRIQISSVNNYPIDHLPLFSDFSFQINNSTLKKFPLRVNPMNFKIQTSFNFLLSFILIRIDNKMNIFVNLSFLILKVLKINSINIKRFIVILSQHVNLNRFLSSFNIKKNLLIYFNLIFKLLIQLNNLLFTFTNNLKSQRTLGRLNRILKVSHKYCNLRALHDSICIKYLFGIREFSVGLF